MTKIMCCVTYNFLMFYLLPARVTCFWLTPRGFNRMAVNFMRFHFMSFFFLRFFVLTTCFQTWHSDSRDLKYILEFTVSRLLLAALWLPDIFTFEISTDQVPLIDINISSNKRLKLKRQFFSCEAKPILDSCAQKKYLLSIAILQYLHEIHLLTF